MAITKTYKLTLSGGFSVGTSGSRGYYPSGTQNETITKNVVFSDIPAGVTITNVTITWGSFSAASLSQKYLTKNPDAASVKQQLNNGTRTIKFSANADLSWSGGYTDSTVGYKYFSWKLTETTITVEYTEAEPPQPEVSQAVARYCRGADGNERWVTCYIYYGANGQWKKCKAYYGVEGRWNEITNHAVSATDLSLDDEPHNRGE